MFIHAAASVPSVVVVFTASASSSHLPRRRPSASSVRWMARSPQDTHCDDINSRLFTSPLRHHQNKASMMRRGQRHAGTGGGQPSDASTSAAAAAAAAADDDDDDDIVDDAGAAPTTSGSSSTEEVKKSKKNDGDDDDDDDDVVGGRASSTHPLVCSLDLRAHLRVQRSVYGRSDIDCERFVTDDSRCGVSGRPFPGVVLVVTTTMR